MADATLKTPKSVVAPDETGVPRTLLEAMRLYDNPDVATVTLAAIRWPDGVECMHCRSRLEPFSIFRPAAFGGADRAGSNSPPKWGRSLKTRPLDLTAGS